MHRSVLAVTVCLQRCFPKSSRSSELGSQASRGCVWSVATTADWPTQVGPIRSAKVCLEGRHGSEGRTLSTASLRGFCGHDPLLRAPGSVDLSKSFEKQSSREAIYKLTSNRGAWGAQLVKRRTLDLASGHDLTVAGSSPASGLRSVWSLVQILSPSPCPFAPPCSSALSFSLKEIKYLISLQVNR